ncbi:hypothetical protein AVEN_173370-1 [Araneus ventricosus]|uniref:DDE Tnp4 domain-containing protein n=1 Tax=Araneus ventricosus TaxID=182803 RepID=A0A4Y2NIS5_ARAVE|nr:hypothetical protein AVEN_173370-1 [Araneus ventricosus]
MEPSTVPIFNPGGDLAEVFRCRKGYFSLNVQTISDASLHIRDIVACWPDSTLDSTVFDNSHLRAVLENEVPPEYHLVGGNGYGCRSYLLTPFLDPSTPEEIRYNVAHKASRNVVERQYGIMKRFACLETSLRCSLQNVMTVIVAIAVLHNMALQMDDVFEEEDDEGNTPK